MAVVDFVFSVAVISGLYYWWWRATQSPAARQRQANDRQAARVASGVDRLACPNCHSHGNVNRVTVGQRASSAVLGGLLFSRKARAQFECGNCRYVW